MNTNGFYGPSGYKKDSRNEHNIANAKEIVNYLFDDRDFEPDIIFFSEFDVHSPAGNHVINYLQEKGYSPVYPNNEREISDNYISIVIAFIKKKFSTEKSPEGSLLYKWNEVCINNYRIVGVHIPSKHRQKTSKEFWRAFSTHYQKYQKERVLYIGDMNVFEEGTFGKTVLNEILLSARDAWIEKGNSNGNEADFTYIGDTRVDYAILSESMPQNFNIFNVQDIYKNKWSDHSALIIEF